MKNLWIVHNPTAGSPASQRRVDRLAAVLARRGLSVRLERPSSAEALRQAVRAAAADRAEALLTAGGDGTLSAAASELAGGSVALGILPTGTANVWAREMGLPLDPGRLEEAALRQLEGQPALADMGRCNGHPFLLWAGTGLDGVIMGELARRRQLTRRYGFLYNTLAGFDIARGWRGMEMQVVASRSARDERREVAGHFLLVTAANIEHYGGGLFRLGGSPRLDDGQMEVWLFEGGSYAESLGHVGRMWLGLHARHPQVRRLTAARVEIYTAAPLAAQADGEVLPAADRMVVEVLPRALPVLVPASVRPRLFLRS